MKNKYISYLFIFCLGVLVSFFLNDFVNKDISNTIKKKQRASVESGLSKKDRMDLVANSMTNIFQRQMGDIASNLPGGVNLHAETNKDNFIIYLQGDGIDQESLKINVDNGQFLVSGKIEREQRNGGSTMKYSSTFRKSIPIPIYYDSSAPDMKFEDGQIVIKFMKKEVRN